MDDLKVPTQSIISKKKPPRLKSTDRTISVTIENYSPQIQKQQQQSSLLLDKPIIIEESERLRPPSIGQLKEYEKSKIFYMGESSNHDLCPHLRKSSFRRSDTLDVSTPAAYLLRKTHSFQSNESTFEDHLLASRGNKSLRNSFVYPQQFQINEQPQPHLPPPQLTPRDESNRRSCRMHRSFVDRSIEQNRRVANATKRDVIKCHSFNDEIYVDPSLKRKESKKFNSATVSIEKDLYRSRSNSRNRQDEETPYLEFINRQNSKKATPFNKTSSESLEQKFTISRGLSRHAHSFYVSQPPVDHTDDLRVPRSFNDNRKNHSASLKFRQNKENNLSKTKKSKSFMTEIHPIIDNTLAPAYRKDINFYSSDDFNKIQKSPINIVIDRRKSSLTYETPPTVVVPDNDYSNIVRSFRQSQRKPSSLTSSTRNKSFKKKTSITTNSNDGDNSSDQEHISDDGDIEKKRKRKKIVCIIMTVFLSLVFASVFVVVITLTHSSVSQSHNQTRKYYTFARDSPIHYNVRQENERLMQESMNRGKFSRNFTDTVPLATIEEMS